MSQHEELVSMALRCRESRKERGRSSSWIPEAAKGISIESDQGIVALQFNYAFCVKASKTAEACPNGRGLQMIVEFEHNTLRHPSSSQALLNRCTSAKVVVQVFFTHGIPAESKQDTEGKKKKGGSAAEFPLQLVWPRWVHDLRLSLKSACLFVRGVFTGWTFTPLKATS